MADASAIVNGLLGEGEARGVMDREVVAVPHAVDAEVAAALRSGVSQSVFSAEQGQTALLRWMEFGCDRFGVTGLLDRVWALRENVSAYDAVYVALAEALGCELLTADVRLAQATGPACRFAVVRD